MESINLPELRNYSEQLIAEYMSPFAGQRIEIRIPYIELPRDHGSIEWEVYWNYHTAGYAGELLEKVSSSFSYFVPCPTLSEPFRFLIIADNIEPLAKAMLTIIDGYYGPDEVQDQFGTIAREHCYNTAELIDTTSVGGLLFVAMQFLVADNNHGKKQEDSPGE